MKVHTRMMIAFLVLGVLAFSFLLYFTNQKVKPVYLKPIEDDLVDMASLLAAQIARASHDSLELESFAAIVAEAQAHPLPAHIYDYEKTSLDLVVYATDAAGRVRFHSSGADLGADYTKWRDITLTLKGKYGARATWEPYGDYERLVFYVAAPIKVNGRLLGVVSVGKPVEIAYSILDSIQRDTFFGVGLAVLLALVWGLLFSIWITRPIRKLTQYVEDVRDGKVVALPALGRSDIGLLGRSFEELRETLEGKQYVEHYVQTLTHEIKSPLSAIRGAAELLQEDLPPEGRARFLANIQTESMRIQNLVDRLLELSAIENRKTPKDPKPVDLTELTEELLGRLNDVLLARSLVLRFEKLGPLIVHGERFLLQLALSNLLQNAVAFSPIGGTVTVQVGEGQLRIRDQGPGVPEYALARVFERFYSLSRPDTGKKSSGLGLSIVASVAKLHGSEIVLENHGEGGAEAIWTFPVVPIS